MWARGLKLLSSASKEKEIQVAPRVGAWIETPLRASGIAAPQVAPRVGAWIETSVICSPSFSKPVAPRVGAWIETVSIGLDILDILSRAPCGRVD